MPRKRILVVDDEPEMVVLVRSVLERAGYEVDAAFSAAEGRERLAKSAYDLIILDFLLKDGLGEGLLKIIRAKENLKSLPVIIITAFSSRGAKSFLSQGATDVLFKPISLGELLSKVHFMTG